MWKRRPRIRQFAYTGRYQYFLTFCTEQRFRAFLDVSLARDLTSQILHEADAHSFAAIAYVTMPDHMHWLVEGTEIHSELKAFVKIAKQRTGYHYKQATQSQLWQPSYYDSVLRDEDSTWGVIRYIVNNPVRSGLVEKPGDYELWGSSRFTRTEILDGLQINPAARWAPPGRRQA